MESFVLSDMKTAHFKLLLEFLYTDSLQNLEKYDSQLLIESKKIAEEHGLERMAELCVRSKTLRPSSLALFLDQAMKQSFYSDVIVTVANGKEFKAHRYILSQRGFLFFC